MITKFEVVVFSRDENYELYHEAIVAKEKNKKIANG